LIGALELTDNAKVKRVYFKKIQNYSSKSLRGIFDEHISKKALIYTDKWTGYKPISKDYEVHQDYSDNGKSM